MDGITITLATTSQSVNRDAVDAVISIIVHLLVHQLITDNGDELYNLCISLARGIDSAIANNEVPSRASELPLLLKKVCQFVNPKLKAAAMVLMLSVKYACKNRWFSDKDAQEILILAAELETSFSSPPDPNTDARSYLPTISTIISRFCPRMKMGHILGFLVVKPGYDAYVIDFVVSNDENSSRGDKLYLFVAKTDDVETSECLITPPNVNFLLNANGVEERNNVSMDVGPQIPTDVTDKLTFGPNLLQVVGRFNGNYIIAVAYINTSSTLRPTLQDYVPPRVAALNSGSDTIKVSSRISLNCPISLTRIKTPVKGRNCRHVQCFDFDCYVEINSTRPSWRCPYCYQYVCFTDIRIDQNMVKVLNEIETSITNVIISADGSYKAVTEINDQTYNRRKKNPCVDIVDLTDRNFPEDGIPDRVLAISAWDPASVPQTIPGTILNMSINGGPSPASQISLPLHLIPLWVPHTSSSSLQHHVGPQSRTGLCTVVRGGSSASLVPPRGPSSSRLQHVGSQPRTDLKKTILSGPSSALQVPQVPSSLLQQNAESQNWSRHDNFFTSNQPVQRLGSFRPPQVSRPPCVSSAHNIRRPHIMSHSPNPVRPSPHSLPPLPENADLSRPASAQFPRSNNTVELSQAELNWQPTGLMRGSLSGQAYYEAMAHFYNLRPRHPAARSVSSTVEPPPGFSPQLQTLLANNRNWCAQGGTNLPSDPGSVAGTSGSKPEPSLQ